SDGATGPAGADGSNGTNGSDGATGPAGSSCSVEQVGNTAVITCTDGTTATIIGP
ncbi:MAG: hypothetical protein JHC41_06560, partial [Nitrosopumilus sp.]|nr:hypothetical protein [Nitrosopumilus sp.]